MHPNSNTPERFWAKLDKSGDCWIWTGKRVGIGYGSVSWHGKDWRAHRLAYMLTFGPIPDGLQVCHNCPGGDNPACCRPAHLFLGTQAQNIADKTAKGRQATGERHGSRTHPERLRRGDDHPLRLHPERAARGERNGRATHPEGIRRGADHPLHMHPEWIKQGSAVGTSILTEGKVREILRSLAQGVTQTALAAQYQVTLAAINKIARRKNWRHVAID
jgi:hypothetical protein